MRITQRSSSLLTAALVVGACATGALAQHQIRPKYQLTAFNEDWSNFEDPGDQCWWDQFKHMKLTDDGSVWASVGGELRFRGEYWEKFWFGVAPGGQDTDDAFLLGRALLHADLHFGENVRVFVEGESSLASDRDLRGGRRGGDVDSLDLQNAFIDLTFPMGDEGSLTARIGRQEISLGAERLVCHAWWANAQRSHDAVLLSYSRNALTLNAFYTRYVPTKKYEFNDWYAGPDVYGVYATSKFGKETPVNYDLYFIGASSDPANLDRYTIGGRLFGKFGKSGFNYDVEGAYQFGDVGALDIGAYMFASKLGYAFKESKAKTKLYVGFDYASGDGDATDTDSGTFNQLFPAGHKYFGYMDFVGRQNIMDISVGVKFNPFKKITFMADLHNFWRADEMDAMYNPGGGTVFGGGAGTSDAIGHEIDLTLKYKVTLHTTIQVGYNHFFAGDFIETDNGGTDMSQFYFQTVYRF